MTMKPLCLLIALAAPLPSLAVDDAAVQRCRAITDAGPRSALIWQPS